MDLSYICFWLQNCICQIICATRRIRARKIVKFKCFVWSILSEIVLKPCDGRYNKSWIYVAFKGQSYVWWLEIDVLTTWNYVTEPKFKSLCLISGIHRQIETWLNAGGLLVNRACRGSAVYSDGVNLYAFDLAPGLRKRGLRDQIDIGHRISHITSLISCLMCDCCAGRGTSHLEIELRSWEDARSAISDSLDVKWVVIMSIYVYRGDSKLPYCRHDWVIYVFGDRSLNWSSNLTYLSRLNCTGWNWSHEGRKRKNCRWPYVGRLSVCFWWICVCRLWNYCRSSSADDI